MSVELPAGYKFLSSKAQTQVSTTLAVTDGDFREFSVKCFNGELLDEVTLDDIYRRAVLLKSMPHPSILQVVDVTYNTMRTMLYVIMEPYAKTLQDVIEARSETCGSTSPELVREIAAQLIDGLNFLMGQHSTIDNSTGEEITENEMYHSLLSPQDIVFDSEGRLKITNLFFHDIQLNHASGSIPMSTLVYASPEFLRRDALSPKTDIWSAGLCIYAIAALKPFYSSSNEAQLQNDQELGWNFSPYLPDELNELLSCMIANNQSSRSDAASLIEMEYISGCLQKLRTGDYPIHPWIDCISRDGSKALDAPVDSFGFGSVPFPEPPKAPDAFSTAPEAPQTVDPEIIYPINFDETNPWGYSPDELAMAAPVLANPHDMEVQRLMTPIMRQDDLDMLPDVVINATPVALSGNAVELVYRLSTPGPMDEYKVDPPIVLDAIDTPQSYVPQALNDSSSTTPVVERIATPNTDQAYDQRPPMRQNTYQAPEWNQPAAAAYKPATVARIVAEPPAEYTSLMSAAMRGDVSAVTMNLHEAGKKLGDGRTALMIAADSGQADVVALLAERREELEATDNDGWQALDFAARAGDLKSVKVLLDNQKYYTSKRKDGSTALFQAVFWNKPDCVRKLAERLAGQQTTREYWQGEGFTALMEAAKCCRVECVEILAKTKELTMRDSQGRSALAHCQQAWDHVCDSAAREECISILRKAGLTE
ncbi:Kinase, NEK [Giardia muris]|uniref:Kinase, NEK n=1 Tax=Giardia muris TaxID=5742 RepID=A0A4Z1T9A4_GIAMU|nr:Kinase, NEK [Giardia muris]|eukprot:TNJ29101.1 Kinase, NEK [Giardia muris]